MTKTRAEAQRLVNEGRVEIWARTDWGDSSILFHIGAHVTDQDGERHTVLRHYGYWKCGCAKGYCLPNAGDLCAHALTVQIVAEREKAR